MPAAPHPPRLRSFDVAELVAASAEPVSLDRISSATGIPKPTAHRLVSAMVDAGILLREPGAKRYSAGGRLSAIAIGIMNHSAFAGERRAILKALVDKIGETCNFTARDGTDVIYVDRVEADWPLRVHLQPGSRVPIHATASGKLFLSSFPAPLRRRMLYGAPLQRFTRKTITDPHRLEIELARIRKSKIATDDEGFLAGLIAVAVPVRGRNRRMIATLAVHAPTARMSLKRALEQIPLLRQAASDLGRIYQRIG